MKANRRAWLKRWVLIAFAPFFVFGSVYQFYVQVLRPFLAGLVLDGGAKAVVVRAEQLRQSARTPGFLGVCDVRYEFVVDGVHYEGPQGFVSTIGGNCPPLGSAMNITYAVDNPAYNVWGMEYIFSGVSFLWIFLTFGIFFVLMSNIISFFRRVRTSKPLTSHSQGDIVEVF